MPFHPDESLPRVERALAAELMTLQQQPRSKHPLRQIRLPNRSQAAPPRLAVVAADAGNLELRLHPLRIGLVRVATSARDGLFAESFVPLSRSAAEQLEWVFSEPSMTPLREAASEAGLDPTAPEAWLPAALSNEYSLHFLRELLEWLLLLHTAHTAAPGTLLLRDGLLRSVAIPHTAFKPICRSLRRITTARGIWLCAIAKRAPGGSDFLHYLDLALEQRLPSQGSPTAFEVPPALEEQFSPSAYASMRGRRAGLLYLWVSSRSRHGRPLAIEIPSWQRPDAGFLLQSLAEFGRGGFPEPGYPPELLAAHQAARIAPIEREALGRAFLLHMTEARPELRERLLISHLTGHSLALGHGTNTDHPGDA